MVPNVATFTGGVILGNATAFPAQSFATSPNIYATAGFGSGLSSTLSIFINPAFGNVNEVSFPVFNGATQPVSYVVTAYNGASVVGTQTFTNLPANTASGFGIVDLIAASITSVTIAPLTLDASCCQGWDFGIDSVALNQSVRTALSTPEPASFGMMGAALLAIFEVRRRAVRK
ncbi:MAG: PEP-CTERM sorting domain-containing protein [Acidobacteriota bacterium]